MKNFKSYTPEKYAGSGFQKVEEGIYRTTSPYGKEEIFVTSLSFEMEPERYEELNNASDITCYQEFGSFDVEDIQRVRTLIGKRFYAVSYIGEEDGKEYYRMVTE